MTHRDPGGRWLTAAGLAFPVLVAVLLTLPAPRSLGILVAVLGAMILGPRLLSGPDPAPLSPRSRRVGLAAILGLAALLRLWALDAVPLWVDPDSAMNGWIGLELVDRLRAGTYQPVLIEWASGNETAFVYLVGLALDTLGHGLAVLRLPAAVLGTLTVGAVYLCGRDLFGARAGLVAAFVVALTPWHVRLSRLAKRPIVVPLAVALAVWLLLRGLRSESRARWWWFVGCGVVLGVGLHSYVGFRAFPLGVGGVVLWVRGREGRWRRGLAELGVVAIVAAVVAAPVLLHAAQHPGTYMAAASVNAIWHAPDVSIPSHVGAAVAHLVFDLPREMARVGWPTGAAALPALFLLGLAGVVWRGRRDVRALVVATLLVMAPAFALARFHHHAPRRFSGELVPFALLCGAAAAAVWNRLGSGRLRRALGLGAAVWLLLVVPPMWREMAWPAGGPPDAREQATLRWCAETARERDVYLDAGFAPEGWVSGFYLRHPRISRLPTGWLLPDGPAGRPVVILSDAAPPLGGARHTTILPGGAGEAPWTLSYIELSAPAIATRRASRQLLAAGEPCDLLVGTAGRYTFDRLVSVDGTRGTAFALAAGLHRIQVAESGPAPRWRHAPGAAWHALPAGSLWRPLSGADRAPRAVVTGHGVDAGALFEVPVSPVYALTRSTQDLAMDDRGGVLVELDRYPVKRLVPGGEPSAEPLLRDAAGEPFTLAQTYGTDVQRRFSVALSRDRLLLLDGAERRLVAFGRDGTWRGPIATRLVAPLDVAVEGQTVFVADPGRGGVVRVEASGRDAVIAPGRPVSVAARGGTLAILDAAGHALVLYDLAASRPNRIPLERVTSRMRVSLASDGRAFVVDPDARRVLVFSAAGELIAPLGDPDYLGPAVRRLERPVAIGADAAGRLAVLGHRRVLWLREAPSPETGRGFTLLAARAGGNLNLGPHPFGHGIAIDGGQRPAVATWSFETSAGSVELFVQIAADELRPVTVTLDGVVVGRDVAAVTGGWTADNLRWVRVGKATIVGGGHTLEIRAGGLFPHLGRVRIVRLE